MWSLYKKEISAFFSSVTGYVVIGVFLLLFGLLMWVFPETSLLEYGYATLDPYFSLAPVVLLFLIPAVCMRTISEERQRRTLEFLETHPLTERDIVLSKFLAALSLAILAILPTLLYAYTLYELGSPRGNIDVAAMAGSYLGLLLLAASFTGIGLLSSSLTDNQIIAFLLAAFLCFIFYWGFDFISKWPALAGGADDLLRRLSAAWHFDSMGRGLLRLVDLLYFISATAIFLATAILVLKWKKW